MKLVPNPDYIKGRPRSFWLKEKHEKTLETLDSLTLHDLWNGLKKRRRETHSISKEEKRLFDQSISEIINPFDVLNVKTERAFHEDGRYVGGVKGDLWDDMCDSIKKYGVKEPIMVIDMPPWFHLWSEGFHEEIIPYSPEKYASVDGRHRIVCCRLANITVIPAVILIPDKTSWNEISSIGYHD
jgi:hypothetical protein